MKWATAPLAVLLRVGWVGVSLLAVTIGIGYEVSGWILRSGRTALPLLSGLIAEGIAGQRAAPLNVVQPFLQAGCLLRRLGTGSNAGPVFEGGLRVQL